MDLRRNFGLKVLAITLSCFLWAFVRFTQTPFASEISQAEVEVPLEVISAPGKVALDVPATVRVTVRGSKEVIRGLQTNDVTARLDVKDHADGVFFPNITVTTPPELNVIQVEPQRATVRVDPIVTHDFAVDVRVAGKPAPGYNASTPLTQPASVKVKGPQIYVARVKRVSAIVDVKNVEVSLVQRVQLQAFDEESKRIEDVEIIPANAMVTINVQPDIVPRMLPVFPTFEDSEARGVNVRTRWTPRLVPVIFEPGKGDGINSLYTKPVPLSGRGLGDHELIVPIEVPEGATLVKDKTIQLELTLRQTSPASPGAASPR